MKENLFSLKTLSRQPVHILLRTATEYRQAHTMLEGYGAPEVVAVRDQLGEALGAIKEELRERGISCR